MAKKSIHQNDALGTARKRRGRITASIIGFSSRLTAAIAGLWRKLRRIPISETGITKEASTEVPGTFDDYWIKYESDLPDPDRNDEG